MTFQYNQPLSANPELLLENVRALFPEGAVVELRALNASTPGWRAPHTEYGYYDDMEALARDAASLSACAPVVYVTLNEVDPRLLSCAANRLKSQTGTSKNAVTTTDADILRYRYLLVDCDPARPADISSTDQEHAASKQRAVEVRKWLRSFGWPRPAAADSGNGAHLLYRVDLEHTPENKALVQHVLAALALRFSDSTVTIDEKVFNPARITKCYGTRAASKGDDTADRPHRFSELVRVPDGLHINPVTREQLQAVAETAPPQEAAPERRGSKSFDGPYDMEAMLARHPDELAVKREGPWNKGYKWLLACCPFNEDHTDNAAVLTLVDGVPGFTCQHNSCAGNHIKELWMRLGERSQPRADLSPAERQEASTTQPNRGRVFSGKDLMAKHIAPVRWAVNGLLPDGTTLLGGKPKMGKSWWCLSLAIAIASGGVVFGTMPVERGEVLYLALEDNERRLQQRLRTLLGDRDVPDGLHFVTECPRADRGGVEFLEEWLQEHPLTRLVIVDTLAKVKPMARRGVSVYEEDYAAVQPLKSLSDRYSVAILVVTHLRKMAAEDAQDEITGSMGISGGVDGSIVLRRQRGQADAVLHITGRDVEEQSLAMQFDNDTCQWRLAGPADDFLRSKERSDILAVLREAQRPLAPKDIADRLGKTSSAIRRLVGKMADAGELHCPAYGLYQPVGSGTTGNTGHNGNSGNSGHTGNTARLRAERVTDTRSVTGDGHAAEGREAATDGHSARSVTSVTDVTASEDSRAAALELLEALDLATLSADEFIPLMNQLGWPLMFEWQLKWQKARSATLSKRKAA